MEPTKTIIYGLTWSAMTSGDGRTRENDLKGYNGHYLLEIVYCLDEFVNVHCLLEDSSPNHFVQ